MSSNPSPKPNISYTTYTKKVFVDVFTDHQQKFLKERIDHTRGYLTSFANDERKVIAHRFLERIEQAITEAYEQALAEDAELYAQKKEWKIRNEN